MFSFQIGDLTLLLAIFLFLSLFCCHNSIPTKHVSLRCDPFARKMVKRKMVKEMKPLEVGQSQRERVRETERVHKLLSIYVEKFVKRMWCGRFSLQTIESGCDRQGHTSTSSDSIWFLEIHNVLLNRHHQTDSHRALCLKKFVKRFHLADYSVGFILIFEHFKHFALHFGESYTFFFPDCFHFTLSFPVPTECMCVNADKLTHSLF